MLRRSSKSLLHAEDSTAFSSSDVEPSGGFLVSVSLDSSSCRDTGGSPSSSLSFYHAHLRCQFVTQHGERTLSRSSKNRLKRFHRPAIPAASEMTLSMSRGFTSSSEAGAVVCRRGAVGEGTADRKFTFATSASYSRSTRDTQSYESVFVHLSLHRPFLFPAFDQAFADAVALLQEACDHASHFSSTIVTLDYGLMLVNDHGYTLEESRQSCDVIQRGRCFIR